MTDSKMKKKEIMAIEHEAHPGYTPIFWILFLSACGYLAFLFMTHVH